MAIDRIGKSGGVPPAAAPEVGGAAKKEGPTATFDVKRPGKTERSEEVGRASPLEELKAGKIDLDGYLDKKVEAATAHLKGVGEVELSAIRKALRDQLATDPLLSDLVKRATGKAPEPPQED
jgi:hypothetical protein